MKEEEQEEKKKEEEKEQKKREKKERRFITKRMREGISASEMSFKCLKESRW